MTFLCEKYLFIANKLAYISFAALGMGTFFDENLLFSHSLNKYTRQNAYYWGVNVPIVQRKVQKVCVQNTSRAKKWHLNFIRFNLAMEFYFCDTFPQKDALTVHMHWIKELKQETFPLHFGMVSFMRDSMSKRSAYYANKNMHSHLSEWFKCAKWMDEQKSGKK